MRVEFVCKILKHMGKSFYFSSVKMDKAPVFRRVREPFTTGDAEVHRDQDWRTFFRCNAAVLLWIVTVSSTFSA